MKINKILPFLAFFYISLFFLVSCNGWFFTDSVDCDNCYSQKPQNADIVVRLTINDSQQAVPIVIYKGKIDGDIVLSVDTAYSNLYYYYAQIGTEYSVSAKYERGDSTIIAVGATTMKTRLTAEACEDACYYIKDNIIDLRLVNF